MQGNKFLYRLGVLKSYMGRIFHSCGRWERLRLDNSRQSGHAWDRELLPWLYIHTMMTERWVVEKVGEATSCCERRLLKCILGSGSRSWWTIVQRNSASEGNNKQNNWNILHMHRKPQISKHEERSSVVLLRFTSLGFKVLPSCTEFSYHELEIETVVTTPIAATRTIIELASAEYLLWTADNTWRSKIETYSPHPPRIVTCSPSVSGFIGGFAFCRVFSAFVKAFRN